MLGLSATMDRKDGMTDVFKMFLGDVIHVEKRKSENNNVRVRRIDYKTNDDEFNEIKYNFRGDVCYSSMINKLCTYNRRSDFIINVIKKNHVKNIYYHQLNWAGNYNFMEKI